jgi:hypothetical protein
VSRDPDLYPIFKRRDLASDKELVLPRLSWVVESFSWTVIGGPARARIKATGSREALAGLLDLLRCPVEIRDVEGRTVWHGYVHEATVQVGAISMGASLDSLANKVRVAYTKQVSVINGSGERVTSDWATDTSSVSEYGTKELQLSLADVTPAQAEQTRNAALAEKKNPIPVPSIGGGSSAEATVTLQCRGWLETLGWQYYEQSSGTTATENEPTTIQKIGRNSYSATTISFADVSGEWQINDSANGLKVWEAGDYITVSGTALNNGQTRILSVAEDGSQLIVSDQVDNEAAGASVTIAPSYTKVAQSFVLEDYGEDYYVHTVRLKARKLADAAAAMPADNLRITVKSDSGGDPDTTLTTGYISASAMSDEDTDEEWYEWNLDEMASAWSPAYQLAPLTTYWFEIDRTGADAQACYQIAIDETAEYTLGQAKFWDGAAWQTFPNTGADVPFVFVGAWTTELQVEKLIAASDFIASVTFEDASGQYGYPYREGDASALHVLRQLLRSGVAGGRRYLAEVQSDRALRVYQEPTSAGVRDLRLTIDGKCLNYNDREVEPHRLSEIVGQWVRLPNDILDTLNAGRLLSPSPFFVEGAEWNAGKIRITPRSTRSLWDSSVGDG